MSNFVLQNMPDARRGNIFSPETELKFPETLFLECTEDHDFGNAVAALGNAVPWHAAAFQIECSADGVITHTGPFSGGADMPQCRPKVCSHPPQVFAEHREVRDYISTESSVSVGQGGDVQIIHDCGADGQFHVTSSQEFHLGRGEPIDNLQFDSLV